MTLLEDIQSAAIDATIDLATLLRKCKLLAARLGSQPLENWVVWESNGYPDDVPVPDYRVWSLELKGHFTGPLGSGLRNAPIPLACLPEKARNSYERYECRQSIASIENVLAKADSGSLNVSAGDLALILGTDVYQGQNCLKAWAEVSTGSLVEVVNAVRNRILDFSLAVWKEAPNAGESREPSNPQIEPSSLTQIFNTTVYGGSANLVGQATASAIAFAIQAGDFHSLKRVLLDNGIEDSDINELHDAVEAEPTATAKKGLGPKVSSWVSKMMGKAADGSWTIGLGAAGNLIAQAIAKFYGL